MVTFMNTLGVNGRINERACTDRGHPTIWISGTSSVSGDAGVFLFEGNSVIIFRASIWQFSHLGFRTMHQPLFFLGTIEKSTSGITSWDLFDHCMLKCYWPSVLVNVRLICMTYNPVRLSLKCMYFNKTHSAMGIFISLLPKNDCLIFLYENILFWLELRMAWFVLRSLPPRCSGLHIVLCCWQVQWGL